MHGVSPEADLRGGTRELRALPIFCNHLFFFAITLKNYKNVLFEVKLILNNAPLTYAYPDTIRNMLHPIICYLADSYYILLTQHQV